MAILPVQSGFASTAITSRSRAHKPAQPARANPRATNRPAEVDPATPIRAAGRQDLVALSRLGRRLDPKDLNTQRLAASQMVSELFFKPLLAQMREFPFGQQFAHGGRVEQVFAGQLDERIADTVAATTGGSLVQQIVRELQPSHASDAATNAGSLAQ